MLCLLWSFCVGFQGHPHMCKTNTMHFFNVESNRHCVHIHFHHVCVECGWIPYFPLSNSIPSISSHCSIMLAKKFLETQMLFNIFRKINIEERGWWMNATGWWWRKMKRASNLNLNCDFIFYFFSKQLWLFCWKDYTDDFIC